MAPAAAKARLQRRYPPELRAERAAAAALRLFAVWKVSWKKTGTVFPRRAEEPALRWRLPGPPDPDKEGLGAERAAAALQAPSAAEKPAEAAGRPASRPGLFAESGWRPFAKLLKADGREALKPEELSESLAPAAARPLEGAAPMAAEERAFRLEIAGAEGFPESMAFEEERPPADAGGRQRPAAGKLPPERKPAPAEAPAEEAAEALGNAAAEGGLAGPGWRRAAAGPGWRPFAKLLKADGREALKPEELSESLAPAAPRPRQPEGL